MRSSASIWLMIKSYLPSLNVSSLVMINNNCFIDLVAIRSQQQWPDDPQGHMMDYFGNYKSPEWEEMHKIEEENEKITEDLPLLEEEIGKLKAQLGLEKRKTRLVQAYRAADPESTVSRKLNVKSVTRLLTSSFCLECSVT